MDGRVESDSSFIYFMYFSIRYVYTTLFMIISCVLENKKIRKGERDSPNNSQVAYPAIQSLGHVHSKVVQQSHPGLYL